MSKHKFACFECRQAIRRDFRVNDDVRCPSCGKQCVYLGVRIPIPPKSKPEEWDALLKQLASALINHEKEQPKVRVAKIHRLEKEIQKLEGLPENQDRRSLLKRLKQELSWIT